MTKKLLFVLFAVVLSVSATAQKIRLRHDEPNQKVDVWFGDRIFTSYSFADRIMKPVFYPVYTASGITITRGFPYQARPFEHADHPHQVGLSFLFGNVNNVDFWNNSYARPAEDKYKYGTIRNCKITRMEDGDDRAVLAVETEWADNNKKVLLTETVTYVFSGKDDMRSIERTGQLTAANGDVLFSDNKEGLWLIRLDKAFEEPATIAELHTDAQGYVMPEKTIVNRGTLGVMRDDKGAEKEAAIFGKPTRWLSNSTVKDGEKVTVILMDNKQNVGYPARAFARGYGMMAINNLGTQCYIPTEKPFSYTLEKGKTVEFKHKFIVVSGREIATEEIEQMFNDYNAK